MNHLAAMPRRDALSFRVALAVTEWAAFVVARFRPIVKLPMSEAECEHLGVPEGSVEPAVVCWPLKGASRWALDLWTEVDGPSGQSCLRIRLLGCSGEIWFHPKT